MKGDDIMFLFLILATIVLILITFIVLAVGTVGAAGVIIFGDVIVCIVLIIWLIVKIFRH